MSFANYLNFFTFRILHTGFLWHKGLGSGQLCMVCGMGSGHKGHFGYDQWGLGSTCLVHGIMVGIGASHCLRMFQLIVCSHAVHPLPCIQPMHHVCVLGIIYEGMWLLMSWTIELAVRS